MSFNTDFKKYIKFLPKKNKITCFTISNTSKEVRGFYFTPMRTFDGIAICGVVVTNSLEAKNFVALADGRFDYIALDSEKKIDPSKYAYPSDLGNIKGEAQDIIKKSKVITFKANDVTVNAIDIFVSDSIQDITSPKIAVVGAGNIGFKLALRLLERGFWVKVFRRDQEKLRMQVDCINMTKPKGTLAAASACRNLGDCISGSAVVVAVANESGIISLNDIKLTIPDVLLIDCGKNCFTQDVYASKVVFRTDVSMSLLYQLKAVIMSREVLHTKFGKRESKGKTYVCGVAGKTGDIVLRDIKKLNSVIGICDGKGMVRDVL